MFQTERKTVSRRICGTEIVRATLSYPVGFAFLEDLSRRAQMWVEQTLTPHAERVFTDDPDPSKRFCFRCFDYCLCVSLSQICEDVAELCVEATLDRARGERLCSERAVHAIRLSDGAILPPREVERMKKSTQTSASSVI